MKCLRLFFFHRQRDSECWRLKIQHSHSELCGHVLLNPTNHLQFPLQPAAPPSNISLCLNYSPPLPLPPPPSPSQSDSVGPGHSPVVRPALNAGLLPPNYQLQSSASTPGAGQAGNDFSPLGRTSGWAVYGGGWALCTGGVNGPSRVTVSGRIHRSLITASRCTADTLCHETLLTLLHDIFCFCFTFTSIP